MAKVAKTKWDVTDQQNINEIFATAKALGTYQLEESKFSTKLTIASGGVRYVSIGPGMYEARRDTENVYQTISISNDGLTDGVVVRIAGPNDLENKEESFAGTDITSVREIRSEAFANCKQLTSVSFKDCAEMPIFFNKDSWPNTPKLFCKYRKSGAAELTTIAANGKEMTLSDPAKGIYYSSIPADITYAEVYFECEDEERTLQTTTLTFDSTEKIDALVNCLFYTEGSNWTDGDKIIKYTCKYNYHYNPGTGFLEGNGLKIDGSAFFGSAIGNLNLPRRTVVIEPTAFRDCTSLTTVTIPTRNRLLEIKTEAFRNCTALSGLTLAEGIKKIGENAFQQCASLTQISFPASLESIGNFAFNTCRNLSYIDFRNTSQYPSRIESIGGGAFALCGAIGEVERYGKLILPRSLKYIGASAFDGLYHEDLNTTVYAVQFENRYTWFISGETEPNYAMQVRDPSTLLSESDNYRRLVYGDTREYHWHRLSNMLPPTLSYNAATNEITIRDELGLADEFILYVNPGTDSASTKVIDSSQITDAN